MSTAYYRLAAPVDHLTLYRGLATIIRLYSADGEHIAAVTTDARYAPVILSSFADRDACAMKIVSGAGGSLSLATRGDDLPDDMQLVSEYGELVTVGDVRKVVREGRAP